MEDDEIIIGIERPKSSKKNSKPKTKKKTKKNKKKNAKKEKILKLFKNFLIVVAFVVLVILVFSSSLFNIKTILVEGNSKLSEEKVIDISSLKLDTNIFKFSKSKIKNIIKENSYVEDVKISRKLPSTVKITINERIPSYMLQFADSYVYINNQGYMLEISNKKLELPILTGFTTDLSNVKPGNRINLDDLKKMSMVIKIYQTLSNNGIADIVSKIDTSDERNYTIFFDSENKKVYLGNGSDLSTKIFVLKSILEASSGKKGEIFLNVDLNTERAYFRENTDY